jgi:hypothetical protein
LAILTGICALTKEFLFDMLLAFYLSCVSKIVFAFTPLAILPYYFYKNPKKFKKMALMIMPLMLIALGFVWNAINTEVNEDMGLDPY